MKKTISEKIKNSKSCKTEKEISLLYSQIKQEINTNFVEEREKTSAIKLQSFLRLVKYNMRNLNVGTSTTQAVPFSKFWSIKEQMDLINKLSRIKNKDGKSIFDYHNFINGDEFTSKNQLGQELEIGMAKLVKSMEVIGTGKDYESVGTKKVGGVHTQIPDLDKIVDENARKAVTNMYTATQKELYASMNRDTSSIYNFIPSVQGKIDVIGLSADLELKSDLTIMERDIIKALTEATFTAKNYISTFELKFGRTNPFRVYATIASGSGKDKVAGFKRLKQCIENHRACATGSYFYRIRAIYEITGTRMQYTKKSQEKLKGAVMKMLAGRTAQYLLWNNPGGEIYVIPTTIIVNEIVDDIVNKIKPLNPKAALYGPIIVQQASLQKIALDESQF